MWYSKEHDPVIRDVVRPAPRTAWQAADEVPNPNASALVENCCIEDRLPTLSEQNDHSPLGYNDRVDTRCLSIEEVDDRPLALDWRYRGGKPPAWVLSDVLHRVSRPRLV